MADKAAAFADAGHVLARAEAQLPLVLCTQCGAWGNRRTRKLGQRCGPPTSAGAQAIQRFLGGWHPLIRKDRRGADLPRERIRVTAAYDRQRGLWAPCEPTRTNADAVSSSPSDPAPPLDAEAAAGPGAATDQAGAYTQDVADAMEVGVAIAHADGASDEDDPFGHGGSLDNVSGPPAADRQPALSEADTTLDDGGPLCTAVPRLRRPTSPRTDRKSKASKSEGCGPRDFAAEAVARLGSSLRRMDTDAAGRLRRLKDRVRERCSGAAPTSVGDERQRHLRLDRCSGDDERGSDRAEEYGEGPRARGGVEAAGSTAAPPAIGGATSPSSCLQQPRRPRSLGDDVRESHGGVHGSQAVHKSPAPEAEAADQAKGRDVGDASMRRGSSPHSPRASARTKRLRGQQWHGQQLLQQHTDGAAEASSAAAPPADAWASSSGSCLQPPRQRQSHGEHGCGGPTFGWQGDPLKVSVAWDGNDTNET